MNQTTPQSEAPRRSGTPCPDEMQITERAWLAAYGDTVQKLQEFEQALLALLLSVREIDADDFRNLLEGDLGSTAGGVLARLRDKYPQVVAKVIVETFGFPSRNQDVLDYFRGAIDARNILVHYYFRTHHFEPGRAQQLVDELKGLCIVLFVAKTIAHSLQGQLSPGETHWRNQEIMQREIDHLRRKHARLHELANEGHKIGTILLSELKKQL
jgi:hypothetical protein